MNILIGLTLFVFLFVLLFFYVLFRQQFVRLFLELMIAIGLAVLAGKFGIADELAYFGFGLTIALAFYIRKI